LFHTQPEIVKSNPIPGDMRIRAGHDLSRARNTFGA
jgi:hypothetical protein